MLQSEQMYDTIRTNKDSETLFVLIVFMCSPMQRKYAAEAAHGVRGSREKLDCEDRILSGECRIWMKLLITYRTAGNKQ